METDMTDKELASWAQQLKANPLLRLLLDAGKAACQERMIQHNPDTKEHADAWHSYHATVELDDMISNTQVVTEEDAQ